MRQNVCERKSEARRGEWLIIVGIVKLTVDSLLAHFRIYNSTVRVHDFCIGGCISLCLHVHFTHLFNPSFVPYTSSPSQVVSLQLCVLDRTSHICSPAEAAQDTQKEDDTTRWQRKQRGAERRNPPGPTTTQTQPPQKNMPERRSHSPTRVQVRVRVRVPNPRDRGPREAPANSASSERQASTTSSNQTQTPATRRNPSSTRPPLTKLPTTGPRQQAVARTDAIVR